MFKKYTTYGLVYMLSLLFIYAACGYNIARYCCNTCEAEGIQAIIDEPCHTGEHKSSCCDKHEEDTKCSLPSQNTCKKDKCELIHLKVDDTVFNSEKSVSLTNQSVILFLFAYTKSLHFNNSIETASKSLDPPDNPILISGRTILSSICILRI